MKGRYRYRKIGTDSKTSGRTNQSMILKSGFTVHQTSKGLSKAWLGYNIANQETDFLTSSLYNMITKFCLYRILS